MANNRTSEHHKNQLQKLHDYLSADSWETTMVPPSQQSPYHQLSIKIYDEENSQQVLWNIELSFLPIPDDHLTGFSIIQCFVPLANNFPTLLKAELHEIIATLNTKMPLVGFGFLADMNLLYYKHNAMLPNNNIDGAILSETLAMVTYLISTYTYSIVNVATGVSTVTEAIALLKENALFN